MCALLGGLYDLPCGGETGSENDQRIGALRADPAEEVKAVEGLQIDRCDDHADRRFLDHLDRLARVIAAEDAQALRSKMLRGPVQEIQIGIDKQQGFFCVGFGHKARWGGRFRDERKECKVQDCLGWRSYCSRSSRFPARATTLSEIIAETSEHAVHLSRRSERTVRLWVERTLSLQHNHGDAATR